MLRYGFRELLLVQPGATRFRPPVDPEDPVMREAIERGKRDRLAGRGFGDWSQEEMRAWTGRHRAVEWSSRYELARNPDMISAPPPWPQDIALCAGEAALAAVAARGEPLRVATAPWLFVYAAGLAGMHRLRLGAERGQAQRLGLSAATTPLPRTAHTVALVGVVALGDLVLLRKQPRYPWMLESAAGAIRTFNRRRAWHAAYGR